MKKVAKRAAPVAAATVATAGAVTAARKSPAARSVISRVVEQVRDTAGNVTERVSDILPGRSSEEPMKGGPTDMGDTGDMGDEF